MGNCAGIDWASEKHDVLIEDAAGDQLLAATFAHDEDGISALCAALACFDVEVVAIERPDGLLVDRRLEAAGTGVGAEPAAGGGGTRSLRGARREVGPV
jgi:Transposase